MQNQNTRNEFNYLSNQKYVKRDYLIELKF